MIKCGLLGAKLGHSYSPQIHQMLGEYSYDLFEKTPEELENFLRKGDWDGLNVTIPYKKTVFHFCDHLSEIAVASGSVNTLVKRPDGSIYGDNTDAFGFSWMLKKNKIDPNGKKVLLLGNGGACASIRCVLEQAGALPVVISRRGENNYNNLDRHKDTQLIVNTTPVGMYPHNQERLLDPSWFPACEAVLDIIYNPFRTGLLLDAQAAGIPAGNGLCMLVAQAKKSSEHFTGQSIPDERIDEIERELSLRMQNLILIGMPGSGKSSAAEMLSEKTGRKYLDLDQLFEEEYGITPADCILTAGEEEFRRKETEVIRKAGALSGMILSTGGGCVTRKENYPLLHQNGVIIWIKRDPELLPLEGRPLSRKESLMVMYQRREPMYREFADLAVDNNKALEETVQQIMNYILQK